MAGQRQKQPAPATTTIIDAAKRLGIGRNQAYEAAHRGEIPVIKIGKRLLVPTAALDRLLSGESAA
jgi:excisionase family DNA binding protein